MSEAALWAGGADPVTTRLAAVAGQRAPAALCAPALLCIPGTDAVVLEEAGGSAGGVGHYAAASASSLQGQRPAGVAEARKDDPQTAGIGPNGLRLDRRKFAQYSLRQSLQGAHLVRGGEGLWCVSSGASRWATESPKASAMRTRLSTERLRWPCSISLMYPKVRPVLAASAG